MVTTIYYKIMNHFLHAPTICKHLFQNLRTGVRVAFSRSVPVIPGVQVYNTSWKPPGRSFTGFDSYLELNFTGCDFNVSWILDDGSANFMCNVTCPSEGIMDEAIAGNSAMALDVAIIINFFLQPMTLFPA